MDAEAPRGLWLVSPTLSALALAAYMPTICSGTGGGDAGELLQLAIELGVPHPPGYPSWTIIAHLFYLLPIPDTTPAWRVNLSSACFDALAAGVLCSAVGCWAHDIWAGLAAGGAFAFAPLVWEYAVQSEVFALNNLLCACLLLSLVRFDARRTIGRACAGAFVAGLSLTNQHTAVFFVLPFALWVVLISGEAKAAVPSTTQVSTPNPGDSRLLLQPRKLLLLGACGLLGLTPYVYLPVRGGDTAAWGSWGSQRSIGGFLTHLFRIEYGTFQLANSPPTGHHEFRLRIWLYFCRIEDELPPHGSLFTFIGLCTAVSIGRLRRIAVPMILAYALYVLAFHWLANLPASSPLHLSIQQRFWAQPNLLISAWFGLGVGRTSRRLMPGAPGAAAAILSCVLVALHLARGGSIPDSSSLTSTWFTHGQAGFARLDSINDSGLIGFSPADCSGSSVFDEFGHEVLRSLPPGDNVLLLTYGDEVVNAIRYPHRILRSRQNLTIVDLNYAQFKWFISRARVPGSGLDRVAFPGAAYGSVAGSFVIVDFLDANYERFSIYVCGGMHPQDSSWQSRYRLWPTGAVSKVARRDLPFDLRKWAASSARSLPRIAFPRKPPAGSWAEVIMMNHYVPAYALRPFAALTMAYESAGGPSERDMFALAASVYGETENLARLNGSATLPDYFFRNQGVAFSQLIRLEGTEKARTDAKLRAASSFLKYLAFDSIGRGDRSEIEQGLLSLLADTGKQAIARNDIEGYASSRETTHPVKKTKRKKKKEA